MDLSRPITYRDVDVNNISALEPATPMSGFLVGDIRWFDVEGWGYSEKRSLADGYDTSRVYLGMRRGVLRGTVFGTSAAQLMDNVRIIRALFTPTLCYAADVPNMGFLPLKFDVPTTDVTTWPTGYIPQQLYVRPKDQPGFFFPREMFHGKENGGFSIPFEVTIEAKDPRFYGQAFSDITATAATATAASESNTGDYPSPLNAVMALTAGEDTGSRTITLTGFGTVMTVTVPASSSDRQVNVDSEKKVVTLVDNDVETLRMDLVEFAAGYTWPVVEPGANGYDWSTSGGAMGSGSKFFYQQAFA